VVAQEVKALAAQTAKATDEIGTQIAGMQTATQESVAAIKEISGTIGQISQIASTNAAAVEEQGAATGERNRVGVHPGAVVGAIAGEREQPAQGRGSEISRHGAGHLTGRNGPAATRPHDIG
jgi:methyl-accepting chemotaxis protein